MCLLGLAHLNVAQSWNQYFLVPARNGPYFLPPSYYWFRIRRALIGPISANVLSWGNPWRYFWHRVIYVGLTRVLCIGHKSRTWYHFARARRSDVRMRYVVCSIFGRPGPYILHFWPVVNLITLVHTGIDMHRSPVQINRSTLRIQIKGSVSLVITTYRCKSQVNLETSSTYAQQWKEIAMRTCKKADHGRENWST